MKIVEAIIASAAVIPTWRQFSLCAFRALYSCITPVLLAATATPTDLVATAVSPTRIDLKWRDNSDNESGFAIERRAGGAGDWTLVWDQLNRDFPQLEDMGLAPGTRYDYRVKARGKDGGESPPSNIASATTPTGGVAHHNLLRDRHAWTSSFQWRKVPARQAVDGTQWTRWWSRVVKENAPQADWLAVDMGSRQTVDKVRLIWQRDWWAQKYEIQISDDAREWKTVLAVDSPALQTIEVREFSPATGRYLRFLGLESANKKETFGGVGSYSLYEFEAYAPGIAPDPLEWESAALNKPVSATLRPELAARAVDSHMGTFWSTRHQRESSFTVDLGSEHGIREIAAYWHVPTDAYQIRLSSDGATWRTVADESSVAVTLVENEEMKEIHTKSFTAPERARHVRVFITGKAVHPDPKFTSIILQELLVHGKPLDGGLRPVGETGRAR